MIEEKEFEFNNVILKISEEHFSVLSKIGISPEFMDNIYPTLINIKNEEKSYNLNNRDEGLCFFHKYHYSINNILHSFNAYLLDVFLYINKDKPKENWIKIYEKQNGINTIVNLFAYILSTKELHSSTNYKILSELYVYENLYRHQISHGWINIFKNINFDMMRQKLVVSTSQLPIKNNIEINRDILKSMNTQNFDDLRRLSKKFNTNTLMFDKFIPFENQFDKAIYEPTVQVNIGNNELKEMILEETIKNGNQLQILIKEILKDDDVSTMSFSLNNLLRTIMKVVEIVEFVPQLT